MRIDLTPLTEPSGDLLPVEIVERKGAGHPDSICDHLTEALSRELTHRYLDTFGRILHYNVDKALLWGGCSEPAFGGGRITQPMEIFLAGRAISQCGEKGIPLEDIVREVAEAWFSDHIPLFEPASHLRTHCLVRPGSSDLSALFDRSATNASPLANDTSIGVGYAPLSRLEKVVLAAEHELGRMATQGHPEIGRDIKIMALRHGEQVRLTVACAFVDRYIDGLPTYLRAKKLVAATVGQIAEDHQLPAVVAVNTADDPDAMSLYLTVLGTSAESGDDGQAGRGNRVNGLITPFRPMTMESVPGKNAISHVGKLYNIAAGLIAERVARLDGVGEAHCLLVSGIGGALSEPQTATVRLRPTHGANCEDYRDAIAAIVANELFGLSTASADLVSGRLRIGDWPLRRDN